MLWLVLGNQGGGKSIFLVKQAYQYYLKGYKIYSNIHLNFPYSRINYNDVVGCKYQDAVVILDEIHILLPSRRSMSRQNVEITNSFISMIRKKGLIVMGSTQRKIKVDRRFSDETDLLVWCDRFGYVQNKGFIPMAYNNHKVSKDTSTIIRAKIQETSTGKVLTNSFIANDYYAMYNTNEIVKVEGLDINKPKGKVKNEED